MSEEKKELVESIIKAIKIIETFSEDEMIKSINELSNETGYSKTTVHRILQTLLHEGWIMQDTYSKRYGLGYGLLGYEKLILIQESLIKVCDPIMRDLRNQINETVTLAVIEKENGRCIHKIESDHNIKLISIVGKPIPLYAGATAKCMLAYQSKEFIEEYFSKTKLVKFTKYTVTDIEDIAKELEKVRKQGYCTSTSEVDLDTYTVAAPIFKKGGVLIGSLSLSCPAYRYSLEFESEMKEATVNAANEITKRLGGL